MVFIIDYISSLFLLGHLSSLFICFDLFGGNTHLFISRFGESAGAARWHIS